MGSTGNTRQEKMYPIAIVICRVCSISRRLICPSEACLQHFFRSNCASLIYEVSALGFLPYQEGEPLLPWHAVWSPGYRPAVQHVKVKNICTQYKDVQILIFFVQTQKRRCTSMIGQQDNSEFLLPAVCSPPISGHIPKTTRNCRNQDSRSLSDPIILRTL